MKYTAASIASTTAIITVFTIQPAIFFTRKKATMKAMMQNI